MTNLNDTLETVERTKLNLRMLSSSMYDTPLRIALDRPMYQQCQAFDRIRFSVRGIDADDFRLVSARECAKKLPAAELVDGDNTVFELTVAKGFNPADVICNLGEFLSAMYDVSQWEVYISNRPDQDDPMSVNEFYACGAPEGYFDPEGADSMYFDSANTGR